MEPPSKKRRTEGNLRGDASQSGATSTANFMGHLNIDLSTVPQKTLLPVGVDIGKSQAGQQSTQINTSIGQTFGRLGNKVTNPMLIRDLWNGNIALGLGEVGAIAESDQKELEESNFYWLSKLRGTKEFRDRVESRMLEGVPVATLKSLFESVKGGEDQSRSLEPLQGERFAKKGKEGKDGEEENKAGQGGEGGGERPFSTVPFSTKVSTVNLMADDEDDDDEAKKNIQFGHQSRYTQELLPFLPIVGASVTKDTRQERQQKGLNEALFSNIIRDAATGDPNINPLAMGLRIQEGLRFNGENKILDPVHPGGSLNIGAIPSTTERLMIDPVILERERRKAVAARNHKMRFSCVDDYIRGRQEKAVSVMPSQMMDVQWINANKSVSDFQHTSDAFNTMPVPPEMWVYRRQIDGDVPLQDNLLPAQGLFIKEQIGGGYLQPSNPFNALARQNITFNPPMRGGWNYGTQFQ